VARRRGSAAELIKLGFSEAVFAVRNRGWVFLSSVVVLMLLFPPLTVANYIDSEWFKALPAEVRQQVFLQSMLPIMAVNSVLVAIYAGTIISAMMDEEKASGTIEYFMAYTPYSGGRILFVKLLSAVVIGAVLCLIYAAGNSVGIVVIAGIGVDPRIPLIIFATGLFATIPVSLLLILSTLALEPKYNAVIRFAAFMAAMWSYTPIVNSLRENPRDAVSMLSSIVTPIYIALALLLAVAVAIYIALKDRIVELSLR